MTNFREPSLRWSGGTDCQGAFLEKAPASIVPFASAGIWASSTIAWSPKESPVIKTASSGRTGSEAWMMCGTAACAGMHQGGERKGRSKRK